MAKDSKKSKKKKKSKHAFEYLERLVKENNIIEFKEALDEAQETLIGFKPTKNNYDKKLVEMIKDLEFSKEKRNLFLIAGKAGQRDILFYLFKLGFSIGSQDKNGDSVGHLVLRYAGKKKSNFLTGCLILADLLKVEPDLLYWRNKAGFTVLDYLSHAWNLASEEDQKEADTILILGLTRDITKRFTALDNKKREEQQDSSWVQKMMYAAEDDFLENFHTVEEDQFYQSFADEGQDRDLHHIDAIRNEYERKRRLEYENNLIQMAAKRKRPTRPVPPSFSKFFSSTPTKDSTFVPNSLIVDIKAHHERWKEFVNRKNIVIKTMSDVPWPKLEDRTAEDISKSINDFTYHYFRQIQVDFHPDRFKMRYFSKLDKSLNSAIDACIESKLNNVSQTINQALSMYKDRKRNQ